MTDRSLFMTAVCRDRRCTSPRYTYKPRWHLFVAASADCICTCNCSVHCSAAYGKMSCVLETFKSHAGKAKDYSSEHPLLVTSGVFAAVSGCYLLAKYCTLSTTSEGRKGSFGLSLGNEKQGQNAWQNFASSWSGGHKQAEGGVGSGNMADPSKAASVTNDFYSFVTDIYEWGWGASFHFAPKLWSHDWKAGEAAQEVRLAHMLRATPGMKILDAGCGVGGPMRIIAASTGAHVTGITISEYQVERCKKLNKRLPEVHKEIFRVLKPGGAYVSQEWVSTPLYDGANAEHKRIIEEINFGNSLPNMRTWAEAEASGKSVGFHLVTAYDAATIAIGPNRPWFERLTQFRHLHYVDDVIIKVLGTLRIIDKTLIDVHTMLVAVVKSLVEGGQTGVFTPMYMLCFEKPAPK